MGAKVAKAKAGLLCVRGVRVLSGEGEDGGAGTGEAVAAGGGEVFDEINGLERVGSGCRDFGGRGTAEEIAEERDETADERRVGLATEIAEAVADFADEINQRDTTADAGGVGAFGVGEGRELFRAVDDEREALLRVIDEGEIVDEPLLFLGQSHGEDGGAERGRGKLEAGEDTRRGETV